MVSIGWEQRGDLTGPSGETEEWAATGLMKTGRYFHIFGERLFVESVAGLWAVCLLILY